MARISGFHCYGPGSIPGHRTETGQVAWCSEKKITFSLRLYFEKDFRWQQGFQLILITESTSIYECILRIK